LIRFRTALEAGAWAPEDFLEIVMNSKDLSEQIDPLNFAVVRLKTFYQDTLLSSKRSIKPNLAA
jgi:hypothetical protein